MPPLFHLVIPAFNERTRLPGFLEPLCAALAAAPSLSGSVSLEVVDDGSAPAESEAMAAFVDDLRARYGFLSPMRRLPKNVGKGGAVYAGWDAAPPGATLLAFVDADGAVSASEVVRLAELALGVSAEVPPPAVFAVRDAHRKGTVERTALRNLMGHIFAWFVHLLFRFPFDDTQCGYKIVPAPAYRTVAPLLEVTGFDFDIELAFRLLESGTPIRPEPVRWHETPGSKVSAWAAASMFVTLLQLRLSLHRSPRASERKD
ncbi:hypothetical protein BH23VER1_BH23VER1_15120 [soil metagenome]